MIAPTKGISSDRALLSIGVEVVGVLANGPLTVAQTWQRVKADRTARGVESPISFGWFVLALDVVYALGLLRFEEDLLVPEKRNA